MFFPVNFLNKIRTTLSLICSDPDINHYVLKERGHNTLSPVLLAILLVSILLNCLVSWEIHQRLVASWGCQSSISPLEPCLKPYLVAQSSMSFLTTTSHVCNCPSPSASSLNLWQFSTSCMAHFRSSAYIPERTSGMGFIHTHWSATYLSPLTYSFLLFFLFNSTH